MAKKLEAAKSIDESLEQIITPQTDPENAPEAIASPQTDSQHLLDDAAPQTDSKTNLDEAAQGPEIHSALDESQPSQTEPENNLDEAAQGPESNSARDEIQPPQTESEISLDEENSTIETGSNPENAPAPQTEAESAGDEQPSARQNVWDTPDSQTEPENPLKEQLPDADPEDRVVSKRRRPTKSQKATQSDTDKAPIHESGDVAPDSSGSDKTAETQTRPARTRRARATPVVSIDEVRTVETPDDKLRNDLLDLVESQKGRKILTGTIQGVERAAENPDSAFAVIYHGDYKVIIPATEAVEPPADFRDRSPGEVFHYLLTKRLGAEVDYIVKGVDPEARLAAASRLEAMAMKRREYYNSTDRDGNYQLYEGVCAEARVVSVIRAGMFVDLFGAECYIALRELSYQRWSDATAHFQPGQRVLVKITELDRSDRQHIRVQASVKQASANPYESALRKYSVGSRYVGTVSIVDTNGVFVALDGGIDCLCTYPKRGRPPRGSRVTVRILGINHDTNRIWGYITHMTMPR